MARDWKRPIYFAAGCLFVGLAALGLALPLLPTTPFLLLASSCFIRSSPRAQRWLLNSRLFGPMIRDWHHHRAVRRPVKWLAVIVVLCVLGFTLVRELHWGVRAAIIALGLVGLAVIWWLPSLPKSELPQQPAAER